MISHKKIFEDIILAIAREKLNCVRQREYSLEYYLNMFLYMSNDVVKWESLCYLKDYKPKKDGKGNNKGYHYKSIQNEFNRWSSLNIFAEAHNRFLKINYFKLKPHLLKLGIRIYIDTTCIWNKYGVEYVGIHPEYRKKKATKLGSLIDDDGDLISIVNFIINESTEFKNDYEYVKKTFMHDVNIMQELFDNIIVHFDKRKNIFCGADKAFITQNIIMCQNKEVTIVTPKRKRSQKQTKKIIKQKNAQIELIKIKISSLKKDQKRYLNAMSKIIALEEEISELSKEKISKYSKKEKEVLKGRYKVEDNYKNLKKSERIVIRKDRKIKTFMSFIFIDELMRIIKKYYNIIMENELYKIKI